MRVLAGPPVVSISRPTTQYAAAGFHRVETRDRHGSAAFSTYIDGGATPWRYAEGSRMLSNADLWQVYRMCPDVRACVDGITRKISTWDWAVVPKVDPSDERYEMALDVAEEARRFLAAPNHDSETWQEWAGKLVRDILVFDALCSEVVTGGRGKLEELVALRGGDVMPKVDNKQRLLGYRQQNTVGQIIDFEPDQVVYMNLHGNTSAPGGIPLIESLVNEVITLMRQAQNLMRITDADEVPQGLLYLSGIAGRAAERTVASMREMKGHDDKLRVITSANPGDVGVKWVEFKRTPKELDLKELVHEVRRVVWRVFGIKPVTMGDTEATPRATAEVQEDIENSGLIRPFLEVFEQKINTRVLPLVIGDAELAELVAFEFDMSAKLTPEEVKDQATGDASDIDRGVITVNERRKVRGMAPFGAFADIPLVKTGTGYRPLEDVANGVKDPNAAPPPFGAKPEGDPAGGDDAVDPKAGESDKEDDAPGEADPEGKGRPACVVYTLSGRALHNPVATRHRMPVRNAPRFSALPLHRGCGCESGLDYRGTRGSADLPSDWQPAGRFKGYRALNLSALGDAIIAYQRDVSPLYRQAMIDVLSSARAVLADGVVTTAELAQVTTSVARTMEGLALKWKLTTEGHYRRAARVGRDAAVDFTKSDQVATQWETRADAYHQKAMGYLVGDKGLISDLRYGVLGVLTAAVRMRDAVVARSAEDTDVSLEVASILGAIRQVFESNEHRTSNWSGRLVELANDILSDGMRENDGAVTTSGKDAIRWYFEWADVGDKVTCPTCVREAGLGFRPLSQMTRQPGGDTECRGKCRCVIVFWSEDEVKNGTAVSLANLGRSRRAGGHRHRAPLSARSVA